MSPFQSSAIAASIVLIVGAAAIPALFDDAGDTKQGSVKNAQLTTAGNAVVAEKRSTPVLEISQVEPAGASKIQANKSSKTLGDAILRAAKTAKGNTPGVTSPVTDPEAESKTTPEGEAASEEKAVEQAEETVAKRTNGFIFGRGNAFDVEDLPQGQLRAGLETLSDMLKQKALNTLHTMRFRASEVKEGVIRVDSRGDILFVDPIIEQKQIVQGKIVTPMDLGREHVETTTGNTDHFAAASASAASNNDLLAGLPNGDVFSLNSRLGAPNTIYIDFTGPLIENRVWNTSDWHEIGDNDMMPLDTVAYSVDSDTTTFSYEDKVSIFAIWRQVAEDYAPFNVNVTTEEPFIFTDNVAHAVVTYNRDENDVLMPFHFAGGVAYGNHFGTTSHEFLSPALVYHIGSDSRTSATVSHEVGHQLSLEHWGTDTESYYMGHGEGVDSWSPIMGGGGDLHFSQWSRGEYPGSDLKSGTVGNEVQDDIAEISARMGFAPDDHGNTLATATPLVFDAAGIINVTNAFDDPNNLFPDNKGVIEKDTDEDIFGFDHTGGRVEFLVTTMNEAGVGGANVDLELRLLGTNGAQIVGSNIEQLTFGNVKAWLPAGQYYVLVTGVENNDAPFPAYGSLGQYYLTGSIAFGADVDDVTPPAPNPGGWDVTPRPMTPTSLTMSAAKSFDVSGVEYYFECLTGPNCVSSSWQDSREYNISGLTQDEYYEVRVKSRDSAGNETGWSYTFGVWTWDPDACPNTVLSADKMWNFVPVIMENRCVTEGTACSSTWFSDLDTNTTAYCNGGTWKTEAPVYSPLTDFYTPTNTGMYAVDANGNEQGPVDGTDGTNNNVGNNTGGTDYNLPLTDNCPNTVFSDGFMYDWEVNYGYNACQTEGATCTSTYFDATGAHQAGLCTGGVWVPN